MKRVILIVSVFSAIAIMFMTSLNAVTTDVEKSVSSTTSLIEIKNIILYSPVDGWVISAYLGSTFYDDCGPTHSGGACSIEGLPAGTYTLHATRNGCTATATVYHSGSGITTVYWGPTNPVLDCSR